MGFRISLSFFILVPEASLASVVTFVPPFFLFNISNSDSFQERYRNSKRRREGKREPVTKIVNCMSGSGGGEENFSSRDEATSPGKLKDRNSIS